MGSKSRIAKEILPIILKHRKPNQFYIEPFCGGCNAIDKVEGNRIANDYNFYLIKMWEALVNKNYKPKVINREEYKDIRDNKTNYAPELVGWVGFNCSYSGKYFGGFAGLTTTKNGAVRDYQQEAFNNVKAQIPKLKGVKFHNSSFDKLTMPDNSIIYCDPPYESTTRYADSFDHSYFWQWVRQQSKEHTIFVSEYNAPNDFECVWQKKVSSSLSANGKVGSNKHSIEKLFIYKG